MSEKTLRQENRKLRDKIAEFEHEDVVRREGEHWYELVEYFDAKAIERIPVKGGRAFIMGKLDDVHIVEVSKDLPLETVKGLGQYLADNGIDALLVSAGVRFLKLRPTTEDQSQALDKHELVRREEDEDKDRPPPPTGPPEPEHIPQDTSGGS